MKKFFFMAALLLALSIMVSLSACAFSGKESFDEESSSHLDEALYNADVGDTVYFGTYEQDNDTSDGKEDIEWIVLAKEKDRILVISKYALDSQAYNTKFKDVTWEECSLRRWLNGSFMTAAFTKADQAHILTVTVTADKNPEVDSSPGNDTQDQVFLLSIAEAEKYFCSDSARQCEATAYAEAQRATVSDTGCVWWLRSPGINSDCAAFVKLDGSVYYYGDWVSYVTGGVRPALWIDLGY
ncbi:MAG: DUF6273 domain-containing protein [Lachnospiraceae bacterium]|nr:DUF6273 domain-containing protein [Lachnospiraceae bacterium]